MAVRAVPRGPRIEGRTAGPGRSLQPALASAPGGSPMPLRLSPARILAPAALLAAALSLARPAPPASAGPAISAATVEYKAGDVACEGLFARDPLASGKVPGVLVVHDWMGVGPFVKDKVEKLAAMGYAALAADVYGKGVRP